ncbi:UNVERIFIED_CONTAM: hypothetical protein ITH22_24855 [Salmonella enterica subsp. enterica serovar Weltevreden]
MENMLPTPRTKDTKEMPSKKKSMAVPAEANESKQNKKGATWMICVVQV